METLGFKLNGLTAKEFTAELDQTWANLAARAQTDPAFAEELRQNGIPPQELTSENRRHHVRVEQTKSGMGLEEVAVMVLVKFAMALVEKYVIPWMMRGKNREAIEPVPAVHDRADATYGSRT